MSKKQESGPNYAYLVPIAALSGVVAMVGLHAWQSQTKQPKTQGKENTSTEDEQKYENRAVIANMPRNEFCGVWYREELRPGFVMQLQMNQTLHFEKTPYQEISVIESAVFGRHLVLDGYTQSTEKDEHLYHESLVHPALLAHPNPKKVLIGGGGELATAREVLRHKTVEELTMIEIDERVVAACEEFIPSFPQNVREDNRLNIIYGDAIRFVEEYNPEENGYFDLIIMDISEPNLDGECAVGCYYAEFYEVVFSILSPDGVFITHAGPAGFAFQDEYMSVVCNTVKTQFPTTVVGLTEIPSFGTPWGYVLGFKNEKVPEFFDMKRSGVPQTVDNLLAERVVGAREALKYYCGETHMHMFSMPMHIRKQVEEETRVLKRDGLHGREMGIV